MLGGLAIIAHGHSRTTKDSDVWLEPLQDARSWAELLFQLLPNFPGSYVWSLAERQRLTSAEAAADDAVTFGVVRVGGLSLPLDVFRKPNELEIEDFDRVWQKASSLKDGTRLPDALDLYVTKANTGREHDFKDQLFLESLVKRQFRERLPVCDFAEAKDMLGRFLDPEVLQYGLDNPAAAVRDLMLGYLHEFETEGDPYSRDILAAWRARTA